ncbi:preprotein translocase subunit SecG [Thalassorhabdomicrobium marinisediminis]|uniref:Protein-export membrane protein SecG n=1 Tax=Thalassorhabdomicrobium marinisediminis TaxID=2170577 RepID=A0A2T7FXR3_9RHOB|nr:preprotein translocase subunit SecG [Thalassorhabdomicrobium marinisediminis]PVA06961.1 preprotein translocase subunit SecG [Thalassorhabdomicrobium marinisediminis]
MENVVLVVHLLLALSLIGVVLLQRSEGGGLGIGGGGGGAMTGRAAATALGKVTWILAVAFICTSIALTILAAQKASDASVVDGDGLLPPATQSDEAPSEGESLLPPTAGGSADPLTPDVD